MILKKSKTGQILLNDKGTGIVEKYFAAVNGEDFMLIQQLVFGKILWGYESFYPVGSRQSTVSRLPITTLPNQND